MLKKILTNEIRDALSRNPDLKEYQNFMEYISDMILENDRLGKKTYLSQIELAIIEYRNDNYRQCEECGEYYLADSDEWNDDGEHCLNCKPHQDYDTMADYLHDESVCNEVMGY